MQILGLPIEQLVRHILSAEVIKLVQHIVDALLDRLNVNIDGKHQTSSRT